MLPRDQKVSLRKSSKIEGKAEFLDAKEIEPKEAEGLLFWTLLSTTIRSKEG